MCIQLMMTKAQKRLFHSEERSIKLSHGFSQFWQAVLDALQVEFLSCSSFTLFGFCDLVTFKIISLILNQVSLVAVQTKVLGIKHLTTYMQKNLTTYTSVFFLFFLV